tara:strand:- start:8672 stop:10705 length:2034 start_codon:yes stop_codon:yes gene_type:complete
MKYIILTITQLFVVSMYAFAANEGGNGDYCEQQDSICERVYFEASSRHPLQDKLLQLIRSAKMPNYLKDEMLRDLRETLVIYSGEEISVKDLRSRYEKQVTSVTTSEEFDKDGNLVKKTVTTKEDYHEILPKLGIFIHGPIGYKVGDEENVFVRAITETKPIPKVIYFKRFLDSMTERELIQLVLHEQGHRLKYFKHREDERAVEGWANTMSQYLFSEISYEDFKQDLKALGFRFETRLEFPNQKYLKDNIFYSDIEVVLFPDDIINTAITRDQSFLVEVAAKVFESYPSLKGRNQILRIRGEVESAIRFFDQIKRGNGATSIKLRVTYTKKLIGESNSSLSTEQSIDFISMSTLEMEQLEQQISGITEPFNFYFDFLIVDKHKWVLQKNKEEMKHVVLYLASQFVDRIRKGLELKPYVYQNINKALYNRSITIDFSDKWNIKYAIDEDEDEDEDEDGKYSFEKIEIFIDQDSPMEEQADKILSAFFEEIEGHFAEAGRKAKAAAANKKLHEYFARGSAEALVVNMDHPDEDLRYYKDALAETNYIDYAMCIHRTMQAKKIPDFKVHLETSNDNLDTISYELYENNLYLYISRNIFNDKTLKRISRDVLISDNLLFRHHELYYKRILKVNSYSITMNESSYSEVSFTYRPYFQEWKIDFTIAISESFDLCEEVATSK